LGNEIMRLQFSRFSIDEPSNFVIEPPINAAIPATSWALDDLGLSSSGIGWGFNGPLANMGEFFERRHFHNCVVSQKSSRLENMLSEDEYVEWFHALTQTSGATSPEISKHEFPMTLVHKVDGTQSYVPTASIRLSRPVGHAHDDFYPFRDTSGCSLHVTAEKSVLGALREQIERQSLLVFWLTGASGTRIAPDIVSSALESVIELHRKLSRQGQLTIFDITLPGFPGFAILVIYAGGEKSIVKYCPGISYDLDVRSAMLKAFVELWQSYTFLVAMKSKGGDESSVTDRYHKYFLECNTPEVADIMSGGDCSIYSDRDITLRFSSSDVWRHLVKTTPISYLYSVKEQVGPHSFYASKFLSPSLFLHMDNANGNNLDNQLTKDHCLEFIPERAGTMVPFP
jgi:hypothetical protein